MDWAFLWKTEQCGKLDLPRLYDRSADYCFPSPIVYFWNESLL